MAAKSPQPITLEEAPLLLTNPYLPMEAGYATDSNGMHHVAASTYMDGCTGAMVDWWFGWIHTTDQYKLWHPVDHVFSSWDGPRNNDSTYIGGHHLVHEYIGGELTKLKLSFKSPEEYFGSNWKDDFQKYGYSTAICARAGTWNDETGDVLYTGHVIHLIKEERTGCRMRSRFWLGDVEGVEFESPAIRAGAVPEDSAKGLCQHATEEMAILADVLPGLYKKHSKQASSL